MKTTNHKGHTVVEIRTSHGGNNNEGVLYKIECDTCERVLWERELKKNYEERMEISCGHVGVVACDICDPDKKIRKSLINNKQ